MDKKEILTRVELEREKKHKHLVIVGTFMLVFSVCAAEHFSAVHGIEAFGLILLMIADL